MKRVEYLQVTQAKWGGTLKVTIAAHTRPALKADYFNLETGEKYRKTQVLY